MNIFFTEHLRPSTLLKRDSGTGTPLVAASIHDLVILFSIHDLVILFSIHDLVILFSKAPIPSRGKSAQRPKAFHQHGIAKKTIQIDYLDKTPTSEISTL